ncbi:Ger(x)C family spore germination protein [Alkalihalobacillus sp. CinArs1]|uniref:Ger(x)C family spore germination protein n=1 Tax=Alkalihalobacillus sp. CinArs1 TaxID=2995314 RepID=UPI0022DD7D05|nr:Ger(x)C family spore germination protein [Alkalihalobacillus sp. CinArs1]
MSCVVTLAFILLTGCNDQKIIEQLGIVSLISYDDISESEEHKMKVTAVIPDYSIEATSEQEILEAEASLMKEAEEKLANQTRQKLVNGQIRSVIFGEDLASKGIKDIIQAMEREQEIGSRVKAMVAEGEAVAILKSTGVENIGDYMEKMIKKAAEEYLVPNSDIHIFYRDLLDDGIDPVTPLIGLTEGRANLKGTALFKDDRYVGSLNSELSRIFLTLYGKVNSSELTVKMPDGEHMRYINFNYNESDRDVKVKKKGKDITGIEIKIDLKGSVLEDTKEGVISSPEESKKIEKLTEDYITQNGEKVLSILKENRTDSLGLKQYVRNSLSFKEWKALDKDSILQTTPITLSVDVKVKDTGMMQ